MGKEHMRKNFGVHFFENGLTVVVEPLPGAISTAVGFRVAAGARNEPEELDGVSHFMEHMMFKGTKKRTWREINRDFDAMGARYNAYTDSEETCYYAWTTAERTPQALELLTDMLAPALPPDEFEMEKKVVLEEIARADDRPDVFAYDAALKTAFAGHRLSSNVLGTRETVGALTRDQMASYYEEHYRPDRITAIVAGRVKEDEVLTCLSELWGARSCRPRPEPPAAPPPFNRENKVLERPGVGRAHLLFVRPLPARSDRRATAAVLLCDVLGDEKNSRLYWALRRPGLAEEAGASFWGFSDTGLAAVYVAGDPQRAESLAEIVRKELKRLRTEGVKEEELRRVKNRAATALAFAAESPFSRFRQLQDCWTARRELLTPDEMLARIEAVTVKDLAEVMEEFPPDEEGVEITVRGAKEKSAA